MLGVFAEVETNLRRERQMDAAAKAKGVYKGRPKSIVADEIKRRLADGIAPTDVAKRLVYRLAAR